jgi:hypothetical protein
MAFRSGRHTEALDDRRLVDRRVRIRMARQSLLTQTDRLDGTFAILDFD